MAHELNFENGEASMMYVGTVPWHGLGTRLEQAPKTAAEAMKAARLDWEVGLKPVYAGGGGMFYAVPDRLAVVRLDQWGEEDCPVYGLVGPDYRPLQNREAFTFFDPVVSSGAVTYETAGSLGKGERVWVLAKVSGKHASFAVKGKDEVQKYLLLSNGHDGRTAVQVRFTPVRVVCQNTLSWALADGKSMFKIYHGRQMHLRLEDAQESVKTVLGYYDAIEQQAELFAKFEMTGKRLPDYLNSVFPDPVPRKGQSQRSTAEALQKVLGMREGSAKLFEEGKGNEVEGIRGTLWAAYNGVVEYVDHRMPYKSPWQRMTSLCFGENERIKRRALEQAVALMPKN